MDVRAVTARERPRRRLPVAAEGYPLIGGSVAVALVLWLVGFPILAGIATAAAVFVAGFFRDPNRVVPRGEHRIVSPADGRVIAVVPVEHGRLFDGPATRVSIFMSPLNVHINRNPVGGVVERVQYNKGKYLRAFAEKASLDNEQNAILIRDPQGRRVCFVQIAGFVARRIVCYLEEVMNVERGERCGLIMFGSRADIYLPPEAIVRVAVGDRARGAETVIAEWPT